MKIKVLPLPVVSFNFLLVSITPHWAWTINRASKTRTAKATTRQDISYNLDLVDRNGSSALMYSQGNDIINGGFTEWSSWSECNDKCGMRSLQSRERYCTNPSPSNNGADCEGERFQLSLCKAVSCNRAAVVSSPKPRHVVGKLGQWSGWSRCECKKPYQKRYRQCYSHSGEPCAGRRVEKRTCKPKDCKIPVEEKSSLVDIDPKQLCGFNPCDISKCLLSPLGSCVSDYKCRPVFFDENNKRIEGCIGKHIYISPAQVPQVCKINPCEFTRCLMDFTEERCVVGTKCEAVYYDAEGQPQKCTAVLKVPTRDVCGYDPCNGESCQDNPNAKCLVTSKCRPVFVNTFNERIRKCEEQTASKSNKIEESNDAEYEAEPDDNDYDDDEDNDVGQDRDHIGSDNNDDDQDFDEDNQDEFDDDVDSDNDDDSYDNNRLNQFHDSKERDKYIDDDDRPETSDHEEDVREEDEGNGDENQPNLNMIENSRNFTNPLFALLNAENGERRSEKPTKETIRVSSSSSKMVSLPKVIVSSPSSSIDPSSISLQDLVSGKLNSARGLVTGTVKKSMKIISNKKPTTYFYFETKGETPKETRQFMVITAPKTKKSSVNHQRNTKREI